jgi:hypothetical protein
MTPRDSATAVTVSCALAMWHATYGLRLPEAHAANLAPRSRCGQAAAVTAAARTGSVPDSVLFRADSIIAVPIVMGFFGFERHVVAREWARRGDFNRALAVIRAKSTFQGSEWTLANDLLWEGRYSAAAGDTASAVRAYSWYLRVRNEPEPSLVPQRDSARAELARLRRPATVP